MLSTPAIYLHCNQQSSTTCVSLTKKFLTKKIRYISWGITTTINTSPPFFVAIWGNLPSLQQSDWHHEALLLDEVCMLQRRSWHPQWKTRWVGVYLRPLGFGTFHQNRVVQVVCVVFFLVAQQKSPSFGVFYGSNSKLPLFLVTNRSRSIHMIGLVAICLWKKPIKCGEDNKNINAQYKTSWWFQPIWKTLVKIDHFPQIGVKRKNIWKPPPRESISRHWVASAQPPPQLEKTRQKSSRMHKSMMRQTDV